jgi:hypothetical protein
MLLPIYRTLINHLPFMIGRALIQNCLPVVEHQIRVQLLIMGVIIVVIPIIQINSMRMAWHVYECARGASVCR